MNVCAGSRREGSPPSRCGFFVCVVGSDSSSLLLWTADAMSSSFAISSRCVTAYRVAIGFLCAWELADKYEALPGLYSDDGSLPRSTVMPEARGEGRLVWLLCVHAWRGELLWTQALVGLQCVAAACVALGYHPVASSLLTWWLHCSFCWRNASLVTYWTATSICCSSIRHS